MLISLCSRSTPFASLTMAIILTASSTAMAQNKPEEKVVVSGAPASTPQTASVPDSTTEGTVTVNGQAISYKAVAGTLTVGATDNQDATLGFDGKPLPDSGVKLPTDPAEAPATARMFYAAYFKKDAVAEHRPITFIYNGGPGSATMWLHMGTFGPRRASFPTPIIRKARPTTSSSNQYCLLDASDWSSSTPRAPVQPDLRQGRGKAFYGIDGTVTRSTVSSGSFLIEVRPLEFAEIPFRRKLWNAALGGALCRFAGCRSERHHSAVADPELR